MFREMRRKKKEMDRSLAESLLEKSRRGVLAVNGDDGYPYAIPVNYYYDRENQKTGRRLCRVWLCLADAICLKQVRRR